MCILLSTLHGTNSTFVNENVLNELLQVRALHWTVYVIGFI
jgi:hypothetical protein